MKKIKEATPTITEEDLKEFLSAETYEEQLKILLAHSEKNQKSIEAKKNNNDDK